MQDIVEYVKHINPKNSGLKGRARNMLDRTRADSRSAIIPIANQ